MSAENLEDLFDRDLPVLSHFERSVGIWYQLPPEELRLLFDDNLPYFQRLCTGEPQENVAGSTRLSAPAPYEASSGEMYEICLGLLSEPEGEATLCVLIPDKAATEQSRVPGTYYLPTDLLRPEKLVSYERNPYAGPGRIPLVNHPLAAVGFNQIVKYVDERLSERPY